MRLRKQRGFTLMEMMVVIAIIMILGAIAAPTLVRAMRRYQTEATARNVANILLRTRYEAIQRNRRISTIFVPPVGNQGALYGIDLDGDAILDPGEPRILAALAVDFWRNNVPTPPPTTNLPPDYVPPALPPAYSITFSPEGTVVTQVGGVGPWQLAPQVQIICFVRFGRPGLTAQNIRDFEAWLIGATPAGRVRVWRWSTSPARWNL